MLKIIYISFESIMKKKNKLNSDANYSLLAKFLHWFFIFLFGYGIYKQVDNISNLEDLSLLKFEIFFAFIFLSFLDRLIFFSSSRVLFIIHIFHTCSKTIW